MRRSPETPASDSSDPRLLWVILFPCFRPTMIELWRGRGRGAFASPSEHFFQNPFDIAIRHFARILLHTGTPAVFDDEIKVAAVKRERTEIFRDIELFRQIISRQQIEAEKNKAELALYKAQINPHFMFNTLNTLYGLVITKSDRAEPAFNRFISMMKYMYTNGVKDFIPLGEEAEYIGQYIELQKERLNEHTKVTFDYTADGENYRIAPMLLITFVENAFKYGVSSHVDTEITIRLTASDGKISFFVGNSVMKTGDGQGKEGIGITNCRKRLALLYPGKHELKISRPDGRFVVELTIDEKRESDEIQFIESHSNR